MHAESASAGIPLDEAKVEARLREALRRPGDNCLLVAMRGDTVAGLLLGVCVAYFFSQARLAHDLILYVAPEYRGGRAAVELIRAFRAWSLDRGAAEFCIAPSTGVRPAQTERLMERLGLRRAGSIFKERLP